MKSIKIIIDGSNIAFACRNKRKQPKVENLNIIINHLEKLAQNYPIEFLIVVDASLRHRIDSQPSLERLERVGKIIQSPCHYTADDFIIQFAQQFPEETIIISNDQFSEYNTENLTCCKFLIMFDKIIIKPNLKETCEVKIQDNSQERILNVCQV